MFLLSAQSNLIDPEIPDGETIRYKTMRGKDGEEIEYSAQSIFIIEEDGTNYYRIKSHSLKQSTETLLTVGSFIPVRVETHFYGERSEIKTDTELLSIPTLHNNEIPILEMSDLANVLRAYPFENPRDMKLLFLGQGGDEMGDMAFWIKFVEEDSLVIDDRNFNSYKLELKAELSGAMKLFSGMIPKTYLWFSREQSHHLLKMEGSEGPGVNREILMEMISYTK